MQLDVVGVTVSFDDAVVLDDVTLTAASGEIVGLLGPSGSGKSTLLRTIAGTIRPDRGSIVLGGRDVTAVPTHARDVGMVFQDNQLFPHRSTGDNVAFGLKMAGVGRAERRRRASHIRRGTPCHLSCSS